MASVYDRTDIYDLFDSPKKDAQTLSHWQTVFDGRPIRSALDVSIGTGSLTLPLGQLGVSLYGSDLSDSMLARCRRKADERGIAIDLRQSDFRDLTSHFDRSFDCVMSTGNSLAYVTNNESPAFWSRWTRSWSPEATSTSTFATGTVSWGRKSVFTATIPPFCQTATA